MDFSVSMDEIDAYDSSKKSRKGGGKRKRRTVTREEQERRMLERAQDVFVKYVRKGMLNEDAEHLGYCPQCECLQDTLTTVSIFCVNAGCGTLLKRIPIETLQEPVTEQPDIYAENGSEFAEAMRE